MQFGFELNQSRLITNSFWKNKSLEFIVNLDLFLVLKLTTVKGIEL